MSRILIVDNSTADTALIRSLLIEAGEQAEVCPDHATACRVARAAGATFAGAFLRWDIADFNLFELLTTFRQRWPSACLFALFEEFTPDFAEMAMRATEMGAIDVFEKPLVADKLVTSLRRLPSHRPPDSPLVQTLNQTIRGQSPALLTALRKLARVIEADASDVLLLGESGTGKELFAEAIHQHTRQAHQPYLRVQISAIPDTLFESELFGHERNAFTGAKEEYIGLFEQAKDGTLLLDEIGELPLTLQVKLLRALETRRFKRLHGTRAVSLKARVVFATNANLLEAVNDGRFRLDLYHRIHQAVIRIPSLRERQEDVLLLAHHFLQRAPKGDVISFASETERVLRTYSFPGNVRELKHAVERAAHTCEGGIIRPPDLQLHSTGALAPPPAAQPPAPTPVLVAPTIAAPLLPAQPATHLPPELFAHLAELLPADWLVMNGENCLLDHNSVQRLTQQAIDRVYLKAAHDFCHGNITQAARSLAMDTKTFRARWGQSGLPALPAKNIRTKSKPSATDEPDDDPAAADDEPV